MNLKNILKSWVAVTLGVLIASSTASGIYYDSTVALIVSVVLLSIFNSFLKPLLMLFSLPFIILTFGIGIWIINALLFLLVAAMVEGFYVESFLSALWGALVVSIISFLATLVFSEQGQNGKGVTIKINRSGRFSGRDALRSDKGTVRRSRQSVKDDDDVIDV